MSEIIRDFIAKTSSKDFTKEDLSVNEWQAIYEILDMDIANLPWKDTSPHLPVKKQIVEVSSTEGYCYLRFLPTLQSFRSCSIAKLEHSIEHLKRELGPNAHGPQLMLELVLVDQYLKNSENSFLKVESEGTFGWRAIDSADEIKEEMKGQNGFVRQMMSSKCVFKLKDVDSLFHVESVTWDYCGCDQVVCEHGYSARLVFSIMIREGTRFGGTVVNIADLFGTNDTSNQTPPQSPKITYKDPFDTNFKLELESKIDDQNNIIEKLNSQIETLLSKAVDERTKARQTAQTIIPDDSVSCVQGGRRRLMNEGTIYSSRPRGGTVIDDQILTTEPLTIGKTPVANGYMKTKRLQELELRSMECLAPINGLANPFKSNRLNLICHFSTAVGTLKTDSSERDTSIFDSMYQIMKYNASTPSEELAYQIISRTFCLKRMIVIANPFVLPFIEIGMSMSDNCLVKCFSLLEKEYEILWFQEMKSLRLPDFHKNYSKYKENKTTLTQKFLGTATNRKPKKNSTVVGA